MALHWIRRDFWQNVGCATWDWPHVAILRSENRCAQFCTNRGSRPDPETEPYGDFGASPRRVAAGSNGVSTLSDFCNPQGIYLLAADFRCAAQSVLRRPSTIRRVAPITARPANSVRDLNENPRKGTTQCPFQVQFPRHEPITRYSPALVAASILSSATTTHEKSQKVHSLYSPRTH